VPAHCSSIQNSKSKIQNVAAAILLALTLSACGGGDWNEDQQGVHKAMTEWSMATSRQDANAMWDILSPDSHEIYRRELEGLDPPGARATVKLTKAALATGSMISPERRKELESLLAKLPLNPDNMTAKEYYVWKVTPDLTAEAAERTGSLYAKSNVKEIEIDGDRATVVLTVGDPDRISWVRHNGVWKFDLKPSTLRALEEAREKEGKTN
jgi:hypothetical protein